MGAASILSLCSTLKTDEGPCVRSEPGLAAVLKDDKVTTCYQPRAGFVCRVLPWLKFVDKSEADVCGEGPAGRVLGR